MITTARHFLLLFFVLGSLRLQAQELPIIRVDSTFFQENITPKVAFIETNIDKVRQLSISELEKLFPAQPCGVEAIGLGFANQKILIRFNILKNIDEELYVSLSEPLNNFSELFYVNGDQQLERVHSLGFVNKNKKHYTKNAIFILPASKGKIHTYYMLADYSVITNLKIILNKTDGLVIESAKDSMIGGVLIGIILVLMFLNLFMVLLSNDRELWYNFAFSIGLLIVCLFLSGFVVQYFGWFFNNIKIVIFSGNFAALSALAFVIKFLEVDLRKNKFLAFVNSYIVIHFLVNTILIFTPYYKTHCMPILELGAFLLVLFFVILGFWKYMEQPSNGVKLFLIGFLSVFIYACTFGLEFWHILPPTLTSATAFTICVNFFTFFLTVACLAKIIAARQEKEHLLILERENLEKNVVERTQALNIALEQVNDQEQKYRLLAENAEDIVAVHDLECNLLYVAPSIAKFGYDQDLILNYSIDDFIHPDDMLMLRNLAIEAVVNQNSTTFEYRLFNAKTKAYNWMEGVGSVILDEENNPKSFLVTSRNIQSRKESDTKIDQYTKELERSNADLENFAHVASHDIKSPLRTVYSYLQLIERRGKDKFDDTDKEYIGFVKDSVYQMNNLIDNVLAYAKIGKNIGEPKPIIFADVEQMVLRNLNAIFIEKKAQVFWADSPETIKAHLPTIIQVFQNLINNAIKYNTAEIPTVYISSFIDNIGHRVYAIKDNGIGIEERFQKTIFSMFTRLHQHNEYEGTGVGLALCSRLIDHYGGEIWVDSKFGEGSTFYFTLPATEMES